MICEANTKQAVTKIWSGVMIICLAAIANDNEIKSNTHTANHRVDSVNESTVNFFYIFFLCNAVFNMNRNHNHNWKLVNSFKARKATANSLLVFSPKTSI